MKNDHGLILPPGVSLPQTITPKDAPDEDIALEDRARALPDPQGWKILCVLVDVDNTYESGLLKAQETVQNEEIMSPVLFVMELGELAYQDKEKFPTGAWCKEGDFILTRPYTGTRVKIHGKEFRLLNDDQVEAVVQDPRGISRA